MTDPRTHARRTHAPRTGTNGASVVACEPKRRERGRLRCERGCLLGRAALLLFDLVVCPVRCVELGSVGNNKTATTTTTTTPK
jgi:hypothetical protein